jgi:putative transcriptional regulator
MTKKRDIGQEIIDGIREIKSGGGKRYTINITDDAKAVREKLGLSQQGFAAMLNVSIRTLQAWEQGVRHPSGAAASLINFADKYPQAFLNPRGYDANGDERRV